MKLVSIIVPIFKDDNLMIDFYNSLINQTYKNIEIIFIGNGFNNNVANDERVRVISKNSNKLSELRKYGLKESHGEYICFININDRINKYFVYRLVKSMEDNNSNIVVSRLKIYYSNIPMKLRRKPKLIDLNKKREYLMTLTYGLDGKLFKRELLNLNNLLDEDIYSLYTKGRYISCCNNSEYYLSQNNKFKKCFIFYGFNKIFDTFESLKYVCDKYEKLGILENYFYEIEMLFIKNICFIVCNVMDYVSDKIYRYKFISAILDYLECIFPDWEKNPYYVRGYKLGEIFDKYYIRRAYNEICNVDRKKLYISLEDAYDRYKKIELMYRKVYK